MKKTHFLIGIIFTLFSFTTNAQKIVRSTIGSFGSTATSNNVIIQQTVGQSSATSHIYKNDGSGIRQGFHQTLYAQAVLNELNAQIFPNPNNGTFSFQVDLFNSEPFSYQITDITGRLLLNESAIGNILVPVEIIQSTSGIYNLLITSGAQSSLFKINIIH